MGTRAPANWGPFHDPASSLPDLGERELDNRPGLLPVDDGGPIGKYLRDVRGPLQGRVVQAHQHPVLGHLQVGFDKVGSLFQGQLIGRQRVFRGIPGRPAMGDQRRSRVRRKHPRQNHHRQFKGDGSHCLASSLNGRPRERNVCCRSNCRAILVCQAGSPNGRARAHALAQRRQLGLGLGPIDVTGPILGQSAGRIAQQGTRLGVAKLSPPQASPSPLLRARTNPARSGFRST